MAELTGPTGPGPDPEMDPAGVVLRFLESVGRPEESRFYLDLFRARPREQFAALAIDANVVRDAAEAVVLDLRFLAALDLFPTVVLGLLQPAEAAAHSRRLAKSLAAAGVETVTLESTLPDLPTRVVDAVRNDKVPLVVFAPDGAQPADRFTALGALLAALATRKLILFHRAGGLRQKGVLVPVVNLTVDVPALLASRELSRKEALILEQARRLVLELSRHPLHVALTSPLSLLRELFTIKGAGTLLRRGAVVLRHEGWDGVDKARLREVLETSFGRACSDEFFEREIAGVYREESWRGAAVLVATPLGSYLTKFAVSPEAQGEGIARDLWDAFIVDHPVVFWRARAGNPATDWYARLCDGLQRVQDWTVYWKGVPADRLPAAIQLTLDAPVDMPLPGR